MKVIRKSNRILSVVLTLLLCFSFVACNKNAPTESIEPDLSTGKFIVTEQKMSDYLILIPEDADKEINFAASELQFGIEAATGYQMPITVNYVSGNKYLSIGDTALYQANKKEVDGNGISKKEARVLTVGDSVIMTGGKNEYCTYAVYDFMEKSFGFKWFTYEDYKVDNVKAIELLDLDLRNEAALTFRCLYEWDYTWRASRLEDTRSYYHRNTRRLRLHDFYEDTFDNGHNLLHNVVPKKVYAQTHPEWFSNPTGAMTYQEAGQLCVTNEEMIAEAIKNIKEMILSATDFEQKEVFMLGMADCWSYCKCDVCENGVKENGNPAGNYIVFANKIARAINEWIVTIDPSKEVYFPIFAYFFVEDAPVVKNSDGKWVAVNENVIPDEHVLIMHAGLNSNWAYSYADTRSAMNSKIQKWLAITDNIWIYSYCVPYGSPFIPMNDLITMESAYAMARENGYYGYSEEGETYFRYPSMQRLKNYISSQLWWGGEKSMDEVAYEFIDYYYAPVAKEFRSYYSAMKQWQTYQIEELKAVIGIQNQNYAQEQYWPIEVIDMFDNMLLDMLDKIESLKSVDPVMYQKYFDRINVERLWTTHTYCNLHRSYFSKEEYLTKVDFVAKYTQEYKVQLNSELFNQLESWRNN